ncbi:MAG: homoserine/homoserine lactone efflux protein [Arenicella sp.]|jgi:homoserine/homoserine lactone efflux protein
MLSNSIANGFNKAKATAAGDLSANLLQMIAASIGLVSILTQFQQVFVFIKWAGVAYLAYIGLKLIFSRTHGSVNTGARRSVRALYWQGFITSAANPKAILFFAALFPQFIVANEPLVPQFLVLSVSYLLIDGLFLCWYGKFAAYFARKLSGSIGAYFNKISGSLFFGAAVVLGLKDFEAK